MVELTRLNNDKFILNALLIEQIHTLPDTTITLINGKAIVVKESKEDLTKKILDFYKEAGLTFNTAMMNWDEVRKN
ncbi:flagellar FlbD family protein [Alteribacter aurantiacus]|uniref:flagellar FlbD family protein n=1 Tax=Alteribacter aurantiacus TaxID=254410 RepID=UPI0004277B01|nr:flagellar FlbD family protein [Alteribacter aurantiacus]